MWSVKRVEIQRRSPQDDRFQPLQKGEYKEILSTHFTASNFRLLNIFTRF